MDLGRTLMRGAIGALFVGHGTQKLFGWFGGHGLEGTGGSFAHLGLRPGRRHATAAGVAEAGGGLMLALGALTPAAATAISATMITAIRKVHWEKGPWATSGGYEYNLVLIAATIALTESGPGRPSVDAKLFPNLHGTAWAIAALGAAAAGSYLATERLTEPARPEPETTDAGEPSRFQRETAAQAEATANN